MIEKLKEIMIGIMPEIEFMEIDGDTTLKDDLGLDSLSLRCRFRLCGCCFCLRYT